MKLWAGMAQARATAAPRSSISKSQGSISRTSWPRAAAHWMMYAVVQVVSMLDALLMAMPIRIFLLVWEGVWKNCWNVSRSM